MIQIKCKCQDTALLRDMKPLQGALKHRTQQHINDLIDSLTSSGLLQPIIMWGEYIIDGHGRYTALCQLAKSEPELNDIQWPVVRVEADDIEQARAQLLEMNARYGKITPKGLEAFLSGSSIEVPKSLGVTVPKRTLSVGEKKPEQTHVLIKLRIEKDKVKQFTGIIKELSYVEIV